MTGSQKVTCGVTEGYLKTSPLPPHLPWAPPQPPGSQPEPPVTTMQEPDGLRETESTSSLVPVGKLRPREDRHLSRVTHEAGQSGQGHRPLDSVWASETAWEPILGDLLPLGLNVHSSERARNPRDQKAGVSGHLGKEQPLGHQAEGELVTRIVQEVLQPQEGHAAQLSPVPPVHPDLQLSGLYRKGRVEDGAGLPAGSPKSPLASQKPASPAPGG